MKICYVTEWADNYKEIADFTIRNNLEYCRRHGYSFSEIKLEDGNNYAYKKHERFDELFDADIKVILYLDADCLITNYNIKVEDFLDDKHDLYVTQDVTEINGGAMIIKNNCGGRLMNGAILSFRNKFQNEQNVINHYRGTKLFERMKVLPHPSINSYDYSIYPELPDIRKEEQGHWHEGNFILHTPGATLDVRLETLKRATIIK